MGIEGTDAYLYAIDVLHSQNIHIIFNEIRDSAFGQLTQYIKIRINDLSSYPTSPTFIENNRIQLKNLNTGISRVTGISTY